MNFQVAFYVIHSFYLVANELQNYFGIVSFFESVYTNIPVTYNRNMFDHSIFVFFSYLIKFKVTWFIITNCQNHQVKDQYLYGVSQIIHDFKN